MRVLTSAALHNSDVAGYGSETNLGFTKRNVRAILIAGDQVGTPGIPTPGATSSLDIIEDDLNARFSPGGIEIVRLISRPTKQLVTNAFEAMKLVVSSEELFVVMFAGHGTPANSSQHAQAWFLTEDDVFTDLDLANALLAFPARVDTVVVSDCCYGEGLFRVEDLGDPRPELRPRDAPMICISGAGETGLVELSRLANLARQTVAAAAAGQSHRQLAETFAATAVAGRTFHVDARPAGRLDDLVLSTGGRMRERNLMARTTAALRIR
jgi:hypothetical protein